MLPPWSRAPPPPIGRPSLEAASANTVATSGFQAPIPCRLRRDKAPEAPLFKASRRQTQATFSSLLFVRLIRVIGDCRLVLQPRRSKGDLWPPPASCRPLPRWAPRGQGARAPPRSSPPRPAPTTVSHIGYRRTPAIASHRGGGSARASLFSPKPPGRAHGKKVQVRNRARKRGSGRLHRSRHDNA